MDCLDLVVPVFHLVKQQLFVCVGFAQSGLSHTIAEDRLEATNLGLRPHAELKYRLKYLEHSIH